MINSDVPTILGNNLLVKHRCIAALVAIFSLLVFYVDANAATPKFVNWRTSDIQFFSISSLNISVAQTQGMYLDQYSCENNAVVGCTASGKYLLFQALQYLPKCDPANLENSCIEAIEIKHGENDWKQLTYVTDFGAQAIPKNEEYEIDYGTGPSFWKESGSSSGVLIASAISYSGSSAPCAHARPLPGMH